MSRLARRDGQENQGANPSNSTCGSAHDLSHPKHNGCATSAAVLVDAAEVKARGKDGSPKKIIFSPRFFE
jgi:hypothetical protein